MITCGGRSFGATVTLPADGTLELSLAPVGPRPAAGKGPPRKAPVAARATVELVAAGERKTLLATRLAPGDAWRTHRIDLGAAVPKAARAPSRVKLLLESTGPEPVAWSELYVTSQKSREQPAKPGERPNLVLISLDTLRADHLDLYGYRRPTSPNLDRLAAESLVFDHALSASTWTLPSTASMLTGLLPRQHGAVSISTRLSPRVSTLAERLEKAGYRTAAFTDGGFVSPRWGFAKGFGRYDVTEGPPWQLKDAAPIFSAASRWVSENQSLPFFLFIQTYEIHEPYANREGFADAFLDPAYKGPLGEVARADPRAPPPDAADLARMENLYDGEIARTDHYLGRFLRTLTRDGLDPTTAILVTSDHGEEFLEHGTLEHGAGKVFDPNVHVPLILRPAGGTKPRRLRRTVSGLDVAPTLLALAGLPVGRLPGRSLLAQAAPGAAPRDVLVQGLPSLPELSGSRFRLDGQRGSVILERLPSDPQGRVRAYDPATDRASDLTASRGSSRELTRRLAAILAWMGKGRLFARLPDDAREVKAPTGSRIQPRGVWNGLRWKAAVAPGESQKAMKLRPGIASFLVFDLAARRGGVGLQLMRGRAETEQHLRIRAAKGGTPLDWQPFSDPLPPVGVAVATAASFEAGRARIDRRTRHELRALGYVK